MGVQRRARPALAAPGVATWSVGRPTQRPPVFAAMAGVLARTAAAAAAAVARLSAPVPEVVREDDRVLRYGDLVLDLDTRDVWRGTSALALTKMEFRLLELFLRHPHQVLTREVIFDRVWGYGYALSSNTLNVYVGYLRRKTEAGGAPRLIHTVRGVGYVLRLDAAPTHVRQRRT
jgi:two-component system response regulator MprA